MANMLASIVFSRSISWTCCASMVYRSHLVICFTVLLCLQGGRLPLIYTVFSVDVHYYVGT